MRTHDLTDAEIRRRGYQALVEQLGVVGAARFIRQHDVSEDDYLRTEDKPLEGMTADEIYRAAARLESERRKTEKRKG